MNYKVTSENFKKVAKCFGDLSVDQKKEFIEKHNLIFVDGFPSLREMTNAFLEQNIRICFTMDWSNDVIYRIWFPENEEISDFDETIFK